MLSGPILAETAREKTGAVSPHRALHLENSKVSLLITPFGGTVIDLRLQGSDNILDTRSEVLDALDDDFQPSVEAPPVLMRGLTFWLAPQHEWWARQALRERRNAWPPDPWLTVAPYTVLSRSKNQVRLLSPDSPVSGVRMSKTFTLLDEGGVLVDVEIENIRDTALSWGIWSNARVPIRATIVVPWSGGREHAFEIPPWTPPGTQAWPRQWHDDFWWAELGHLPHEVVAFCGKSGIESLQSLIATRVGSTLFVKRVLPATAPGESAPGHTAVEIFGYHTRDQRTILELELHGPCRTIEPGGRLALRSLWQLAPIAADADARAIYERIPPPPEGLTAPEPAAPAATAPAAAP